MINGIYHKFWDNKKYDIVDDLTYGIEYLINVLMHHYIKIYHNLNSLCCMYLCFCNHNNLEEWGLAWLCLTPCYLSSSQKLPLTSAKHRGVLLPLPLLLLKVTPNVRKLHHQKLLSPVSVKEIRAPSLYKDSLSSYGILTIKIRWLWNHFTFMIGIPILIRRYLYIEKAPGLSNLTGLFTLGSNKLHGVTRLSGQLVPEDHFEHYQHS